MNAPTANLCYRKSRDFSDTDPCPGIPWNSVVEGELHDGWLAVEVAVEVTCADPCAKSDTDIFAAAAADPSAVGWKLSPPQLPPKVTLADPWVECGADPWAAADADSRAAGWKVQREPPLPPATEETKKTRKLKWCKKTRPAEAFEDVDGVWVYAEFYKYIILPNPS